MATITFSEHTARRARTLELDGLTAATIVRREFGRTAEIVWSGRQGSVVAGIDSRIVGQITLIEGIKGR